MPPDHSRDAVAEALARAVDHLSSLQHGDGWWKGNLETNVTMDAEDLLLRAFLDISDPEITVPAARWIRSKQRGDGSWANFHGGPGDLSTTCEAWVALRLAGDDPDAEHMSRAAAFVRASGGVESSRVFTRVWLALFGLWPWNDLPVMPPELILLPRWFPLNIYNWGCWARQTIVAITLVNSVRPIRPLDFGIRELRSGAPAGHSHRVPSWGWVFGQLDRALHRYERRPIRWLRRRAVAKATTWILERQEADGGWGGIQPPWVYSLLALSLLGYPLEHPVIRAGLQGLEGFVVREPGVEGATRWVEACQSPVWDTCLAMTALLDAGVAPGDDGLRRAGEWLLDEQVTVSGDWAVQRPGLQPGGWAFEFANNNYPDVDDAAEVLMALRRVSFPSPLPSTSTSPSRETRRVDSVMERGIAWVCGMQSADGGWAAFDADNTKTLATKLPFCDFGAVIDPPSADVTAHVVEMLAAFGLSQGTSCLRGVEWLLRAQETDGSWFGRWGANYIYGTSGSVAALIAAGIPATHPAIRSAIDWVRSCQNSDGGWGEDLRSYTDRSWSGRGESTASQTAWALIALLAVAEDSAALHRGARWLAEHQNSDGGWDEDQFTGTGFPGFFYINYHLYRLVFPVSALGRYVAAHPTTASSSVELLRFRRSSPAGSSPAPNPGIGARAAEVPA